MARPPSTSEYTPWIWLALGTLVYVYDIHVMAQDHFRFTDTHAIGIAVCSIVGGLFMGVGSTYNIGNRKKLWIYLAVCVGIVVGLFLVGMFTFK